MKKIILTVFAAIGCTAGAQVLKPFAELSYVHRYDPETLKEENPDSVFSFKYNGNGVEDGVEDTILDADALLKCRNLQVLELKDVDCRRIISHLDQFPYLQELHLGKYGETMVPEILMKLKYLKYLDLWGIDWEGDMSRWKFGPQLTKLELFESNFPGDAENLVMFPAAAFPGLNNLSVGYTNITTFELKGQLKHLKELAVYSCSNLTYIDFEGCDSLEALRISDLYTMEKEPANLGACRNLSRLDVENCLFRSDFAGLNQMTAMQNLSIEGMGLSNLDFLGKMPHLLELSLPDNGITELPEAIVNCKELYFLDLGSNPIAVLPKGLFELKEMISLYLDFTGIRTLPVELSKLKVLNTLSCKNSQLESIQKGALNLPELKSLYLGYCTLRKLPADVYQLTSLEQLDLSGDSLKTLEPAVLKMTKLQFLNMSGNMLSSLPKGWDSLTELSSINLNGNMLTKLPADFVKLSNLTFFNAENNKLKSLPAGMENMPHLAYMSLNGNAHLKYLKGLDQAPALMGVFLNSDDFTPAELQEWELELGPKLTVK